MQEYMLVGLVDGKPEIIDGDSFDPEKFKESVNRCLSEYSFQSPTDKNKFLMKICKAFSFATSDFAGVEGDLPDEALEAMSNSALDALGSDKTISLQSVELTKAQPLEENSDIFQDVSSNVGYDTQVDREVADRVSENADDEIKDDPRVKQER